MKIHANQRVTLWPFCYKKNPSDTAFQGNSSEDVESTQWWKYPWSSLEFDTWKARASEIKNYHVLHIPKWVVLVVNTPRVFLHQLRDCELGTCPKMPRSLIDVRYSDFYPFGIEWFDRWYPWQNVNQNHLTLPASCQHHLYLLLRIMYKPVVED